MSIPLACPGDCVAIYSFLENYPIFFVFSKLDQNNPCRSAVHFALFARLTCGANHEQIYQQLHGFVLERDSFTDNSMLLHKVCALSITVKSLCACQCDCAKRLMSNCFVVNMHVTHEP